MQQAVEKLAEKYEPLTEKVEAVKAKQAPPEAAPNAPNPPQPQPAAQPKPAKPLELDPEATKMLNELRAELAEITKQEEQNVQLSQVDDADIAITGSGSCGAIAGFVSLFKGSLIDQLETLFQTTLCAAHGPEYIGICPP